MAKAAPKRRRWLRLLAAGVLVAGALGLGAWALVRPADALARGRAAYQRRDWPGAAEQARAYLRTHPGNADALRLLARASGRMGRDGVAQRIFRSLGSAGAEADDFFVLAGTLRRQGNEGDAMLMLERAREGNPNNPEVLHALVEMYSEHDFLLAAADAARVLTAQPGWEARAFWALGRLELALGDPEGAAKALARILPLDPTAHTLGTSPSAVRKLRARALLRAGQAAQAEALLAELAGDREAAWLKSRALLQQDRPADARVVLDRSGDYADADPGAPEPAPLVGSARCAHCHPLETRTTLASRHARTFARGKDLPGSLPKGPLPDPANRSVEHRIFRADQAVRIETHVGERTASAIVEFALGSGHRAVTLLARDTLGRPREYRLTHYAAQAGWDVTVGQEPVPTGQARDYLGTPLIEDRARGCIDCHSTDARAAFEPNRPEAADHSIGCERCHGSGGNHVKAIAANFPDAAIGWPGLGSAAQVTALCAQCHTSRIRPVVQGDPSAVRFQGTTLTWSRCYQESGGGLSCITCHDPHRNAETSPAFYEAICLQCHAANQAASPGGGPAGSSGRDASTASPTPPKPCPINPQRDCLRCHMPSIPDVVPHTAFTDHHIRVRGTRP